MHHLWFAGLLALSACGDDDGASPGPDSEPDRVDGGDAGANCRSPAASDRARKVVVSHPYGEEAVPSNAWEVLDLSESGALSQGGVSFEMGRATDGRVVFTPDGEVGLVAQEDGSLGVFRLDPGGMPEVVHAAFTGSFYAEAVVMGDCGDRAWVIDFNTRANGGGVYAVTIGADDGLVDGGLVVPAAVPAALIVRGNLGMLAAADAADSPAGYEAHFFDWQWQSPPFLLGGADLFPDEEFILSDAALSADGLWLAVGDNSGFSAVPNRVGIAEFDGGTLTTRAVVDVEDPFSIVAAPAGDAFLVASGFGDAVFTLTRGASGWTATELAYAGPAPQIPGHAVLIERGALAGHVLLSENVAVRQLRFEGATLVDLGPFSLGSGLPAITGAIGVQP